LKLIPDSHRGIFSLSSETLLYLFRHAVKPNFEIGGSKVNPKFIILSILLFLWLTQPLYAQSTDTELQDFEFPVITLADGSEIEVFVFPNIWTSSVSFELEGNTIALYFNTTDGLRPYITNGPEYRYTAPSQVSITGRGPNESPSDSSFMPPEYEKLWLDFIDLCDLIESSPEFWELVDSEIENKDYLEALRTGITDMADGLYIPDSESMVFTIRFDIGKHGWTELPVARRYTLINDFQITLETGDEFMAEDPEIYMDVTWNGPIDFWDIHLDPVVESCHIEYRLPEDPFLERTDEETMLAGAVNMLSLYLYHIPSLADDNLVPYPEDLQILIRQAILGLTTYEITIDGPEPMTLQ